MTAACENGTDTKLITINVGENNVAEIQPESAPPGEESMSTTGSQAEQNSEQEGISSIPGFEMLYGIFCLLAIFLYKESTK